MTAQPTRLLTNSPMNTTPGRISGGPACRTLSGALPVEGFAIVVPISYFC
jgi:hypothetical protein